LAEWQTSANNTNGNPHVSIFIMIIFLTLVHSAPFFTLLQAFQLYQFSPFFSCPMPILHMLYPTTHNLLAFQVTSQMERALEAMEAAHMPLGLQPAVNLPGRSQPTHLSVMQFLYSLWYSADIPSNFLNQ
jgi:hypothetical protein